MKERVFAFVASVILAAGITLLFIGAILFVDKVCR